MSFFYLAISDVFFARSWPATNPAFLYFPRCVPFELTAIYRALAIRVSPKGASKHVKKGESRTDVSKGSEGGIRCDE